MIPVASIQTLPLEVNAHFLFNIDLGCEETVERYSEDSRNGDPIRVGIHNGDLVLVSSITMPHLRDCDRPHGVALFLKYFNYNDSHMVTKDLSRGCPPNFRISMFCETLHFMNELRSTMRQAAEYHPYLALSHPYQDLETSYLAFLMPWNKKLPSLNMANVPEELRPGYERPLTPNIGVSVAETAADSQHTGHVSQTAPEFYSQPFLPSREGE